MTADSVPGSTWKNRNALVGASMAVQLATAALDGAHAGEGGEGRGLVVATTLTFHHSGRPLLRVPTTWSWAGMATLSRVLGDGLPGRCCGDT